jgi:Omp85 superfamily domain
VARRLTHAAVLAAALVFPAELRAQDAQAPASRAASIEQAQAAKAASAQPFTPGKVETILNRVEDALITRRIHLHPFFDSAYAGGGFTLGAGYINHVSEYNTFDVRGSITFSGYKRIEAAFLAPRLFDRRATLSAIGGWREATDVGFYGIGNAPTSKDDRAGYRFSQPYAEATIDVQPTRKLLVLRGGLEISQWNQGPGKESPTVDDVFSAGSLPGLGANPTYLHSQAGIGLDWRPAAGYARRGGLYGVTFHDFQDQDGEFGFRRTDYEIIQHVPILRDAWVLSLHGRLELANAANAQTIPFFMLPALGGGSSLRGFASWRFRDRNSLLLQADWRVLANRFMDMALFYDAGRVADRRDDLTTAPLKSDYGIGFRLHGPMTTPLRIEFAKSNEGLALVFSSKAAF